LFRSAAAAVLKAEYDLRVIARRPDRHTPIGLLLNEKRVNICGVEVTSGRLRRKSSLGQEKQKSLNTWREVIV